MMDWTLEQLQAFYAHYTRSQLVEMLAHYSQAGELPPLPVAHPPVKPLTGRGRPSKAEQYRRLTNLVALISDHYPDKVDLNMLHVESGIAKRTLLRLQQDDSFLARLGHLSPYFQMLPIVGRTRLTASWRAVLDVHNFMLTQATPRVRLPLYRMHLLIWGMSATLNPKHIHERNSQEWQRLVRQADLFKQAGWGVLEGRTDSYDPDTHATCANGCPITEAYLGGSVRAEYIQEARTLLGLHLPWLPAKRTVMNGPNNVLAQLLGLE